MSGLPAVTAPYLASVAILAGAGGAKLYRPDYTARALQIAGLPHHRLLVRAGALAELALAAGAVAFAGVVTAGLTASCYLGFTLFVGVALLKHWPLSSCGCFGRPDSRPSLTHLVLNGGATAAAVLFALEGPISIPAVFDRSPWKGGPLLLLVAVISGLAYLVWSRPGPRQAPA